LTNKLPILAIFWPVIGLNGATIKKCPLKNPLLRGILQFERGGAKMPLPAWVILKWII